MRAAVREGRTRYYVAHGTGPCEQREISMSNPQPITIQSGPAQAAVNPVIVVHYHELWLKGGNRRFFLGKLFTALRKSLEGIPVRRIEQPGDRFIVRLGDDASLEEATSRVSRVLGIAFYAVAKPVERSIDALCRASWDEVEPLQFANFAVRAKRSDKSFPHTSMEIDAAIGR